MHRRNNPKRNKGPFQGAAPQRVFQTVDFGSGRGNYVMRQAAKFKHRGYAAVDPEYMFLSRPYIGGLTKEFEKLKIHWSPGSFSSFSQEMQRKRVKTRHINIDMPWPVNSASKTELFAFKLDLVKLIEAAHEILMPNGKIFVSTESSEMADFISSAANARGLKARQKKNRPQSEAEQRTAYTKSHSKKPIYRIEITFGLKKAVPKKSERRKWPKK